MTSAPVSDLPGKCQPDLLRVLLEEREDDHGARVALRSVPCSIAQRPESVMGLNTYGACASGIRMSAVPMT